MLYSKENLKLGLHELKIRVTGAKNSSATGYYIGVDLFEVLY
jgi:hypothetical protein